jgi:glycosyltransferase involved in cell wall biosynthesis
MKNTPLPLISVIMTFYNCENYLDLSILSILNQTFSDFELIIIDDASTDNSESVVTKYLQGDPRIIYIKNDANKWIVANLNFWISISRWQYIARMDGDDISLIDRLQKQLSILESNPEIDIVWTQQSLIDSSGNVVWELLKPVSTIEITKNAFLFQVMNHPTLLGKKSIFDKFQYREEFREFEDTDLFMRMFLSGVQWYNLPEKLYLYRIHPNNVHNKSTRSKAIKFYRCQKEIVKMNNYRLSLKEIVFMYGYLITGYLLTPKQQRWFQKFLKSKLYSSLGIKNQ